MVGNQVKESLNGDKVSIFWKKSVDLKALVLIPIIVMTVVGQLMHINVYLELLIMEEVQNS